MQTQLIGVAMIKTALVVEGGGMRSVFTAGVLDTFLEHGYDPFDLFIGSSAGSLNLSAFISGQKNILLDSLITSLNQAHLSTGHAFSRAVMQWSWQNCMIY